MINIVEKDQTAPLRATIFAHANVSKNLGSLQLCCEWKYQFSNNEKRVKTEKMLDRQWVRFH